MRVAAVALIAAVVLPWLGFWSDELLSPFTLVFLGATVWTWSLMFRLARAERSCGYAIGHLCLAVCLFPVFFLGVFAVPLLVRSDIQKQRAATPA